MKVLIATLFFTLASALRAECPNLTGTYTCQISSKTMEVSFSQSRAGEITTYLIRYAGKTRTLIADGKEHFLGDYQVNGHCRTNALVFSAVGPERTISAALSPMGQDSLFGLTTEVQGDGKVRRYTLRCSKVS